MLVNNEKTPTSRSPYHSEMCPHNGESLCLTSPGHLLCKKCRRASPEKLTGDHFLTVPAMDRIHCRYFKPKE